MKLVMIIGNAAVGKMTVGQELTKITNLSLFHNHMAIELVIEVFKEYNSLVIKKIRDVIFKEFANSNCYGLIFTFMWAFDQKEDLEYIQSIVKMFEEVNAQIYCIELVASKEERLKRNITENRLLYKASKRDIEQSTKRLLQHDNQYRLESYEGEIPFKNYLRIDNTSLAPEIVAKMIKEHFSL